MEKIELIHGTTGLYKLNYSIGNINIYTSERIVQSLKDYLKNNRVNIEKKFYDLKVDTNLVE